MSDDGWVRGWPRLDRNSGPAIRVRGAARRRPLTYDEIGPWTVGGCRIAGDGAADAIFVVAPVPGGYGVWDAMREVTITVPDWEAADAELRRLYGSPPAE